MLNKKLEGKVAIITGASRGIGRGITIAYACAGANVALLARNQNLLEETAQTAKTEALERGAEVKTLVLPCNVSDSDEIATAVKTVHNEWGKIDILVNNAGVARDNLIVRMSEDDWTEVLDTNLKGAFNCVKAVSRYMLKQKSGRIINISSVIGISGNAGQANYAASKAGIIGLTKSAAKELASRGINVNAIAPGFITTDMTAAVSEEARAKALDEIPLRRFGEPHDVARAAVFLASDESAYITGHVLQIDGGMAM